MVRDRERYLKICEGFAVSVRYCLAVQHAEVAKATDPRDAFHVKPLRNKLSELVQDRAFKELVRVTTFAWSKEQPTERVLTEMSFSDHKAADRCRGSLAKAEAISGRYGFGPDPAIHALEAWTAIGSGGGIFSNRDAAERLTRTTVLKDLSGHDVTGKGVNVIVVDRGLSRALVEETAGRMALRRRLGDSSPKQPVPGFERFEHRGRGIIAVSKPGELPSDHGQMIARNVLAVAPEATIWDAPLLPSDNQPDAPPGPSSACQLFHVIRECVRTQRKKNGVENWVMVNAWGVMDPEDDKGFSHYADNPDNFLVNDMRLLDEVGIDVVFAAGNCGEPCPDRRCGKDDCGPGRSIFGMNAHPDVLCVGAVRTDGLPLALSAQGPGRLAVKGTGGTDYTTNDSARWKPDLCAPSHFRESDDASEVNTGTSAACGFAAGVIAALRSVPEARHLSPACIRDILRETAKPGKWDPRLGFGVIDGAAALEHILRK